MVLLRLVPLQDNITVFSVLVLLYLYWVILKHSKLCVVEVFEVCITKRHCVVNARSNYVF